MEVSTVETDRDYLLNEWYQHLRKSQQGQGLAQESFDVVSEVLTETVESLFC